MKWRRAEAGGRDSGGTALHLPRRTPTGDRTSLIRCLSKCLMPARSSASGSTPVSTTLSVAAKAAS